MTLRLCSCGDFGEGENEKWLLTRAFLGLRRGSSEDLGPSGSCNLGVRNYIKKAPAALFRETEGRSALREIEGVLF